MGIGAKHTFVGQFFEEVGHRILGGDLSRNEDGDVCLWRTQTSVEIKSSGSQSSYGFRLSVEQIEHYERISVFPFSRVWYMFFAYRNRSLRMKNGTRKTELAKYGDPLSINRYLAETILWCTIVDLSIISKWKEVLPISTKSIMGHLGKRTVDLKCGYVQEFSNGGFVSELTRLEFDPKKFSSISGTLKTTLEPDLFSKYSVEFPVTAILPVEEVTSFQRMLGCRGFRLKKSVG